MVGYIMIKYVILDFGKVLGYPKTGNWDLTPKFLELIDINKLDLEMMKAYRKKYNLLSEKIVTLQEEYEMYFNLYKSILSECDYPVSDDIIKDISYDRTYLYGKYDLYDDVVEMLSLLQKKYKLLLLSDNWPSVIDFMKYYDIYDLFDNVYVSSIYGQEKKDGLFFDNPIRDYKIKNGEAIFIDDSEKLLDVAVKKGLDVVLMDRDNKIDESKYKIINNLQQLVQILASR